MDNISIQTTQNVDIEYELASIGDRILATLLDRIFFFAYFLLVLVIVNLTVRHMSEDQIWIYILFGLPILFYDLICESVFQGRSFGKMIMKTKVVKLDGSQPTFSAYLLRWSLLIIDSLLFGGGIALIAVLANDRGQRIGDMAAGTTVIKTKQKVTIHDTILNRVKPEYTLVYPQVAKLSDNDIAIIKDVMRVALRTNNQEAISKLAMKTKQTMGIEVNLPHAQFLATVVQDYSHYSFDK